jgi:hypothetical protein
VVVALAGCGSRGRDLSDKQLGARASLICARANRLMNAIPTPSAPPGSGRFLKGGVAVLAPEYRRLRALRAPSDEARVFAIAITGFGQKLAAMQAAVKTLDRGADPVIAMKTLQQKLAPAESTEDGAWQTLQVPACLNR